MNVHILASLHFLTLLPLSLVSRAYVLPFLLLYGLSHMLSPLEAPEICTPMEEHGYDPVFPTPLTTCSLAHREFLCQTTLTNKKYFINCKAANSLNKGETIFVGLVEFQVLITL